MRKFFFTISSVMIFIILASCQKSNYETLAINDNFDYYSFVKVAKSSSSNKLLNSKISINNTTFSSSSNDNSGDFYYSTEKKSTNNAKSNKLSSLTSPSNDSPLDLSTYEILSTNQLDILTPFINNIIQQSDNFGNIENLINNFDLTVSQSTILTNDEKLLLGQLSAQLQIFSDFFSTNQHNLFVSELGNGKYIMYLDNSQINSSSGGCKVNFGSVWRGAVIGFFTGGVSGAKVGCAGGTILIPGFGTAGGCVGGAVVGAAGGFLGGALTSAAAELLGTCFKKGGAEEIQDEYIIATFENVETIPNIILFPKEYSGQYYFTLSPDYINNPVTGPKYSTYMYFSNNKYYFNSEKTCLLPNGYYFSDYDNNYYEVIDGQIQSISLKPSSLPSGGEYLVEEYYDNPFDCNN